MKNSLYKLSSIIRANNKIGKFVVNNEDVKQFQSTDLFNSINYLPVLHIQIVMKPLTPFLQTNPLRSSWDRSDLSHINHKKITNEIFRERISPWILCS